MGKHGIVCEKGVNDMPKGWIIANEYNKRVYHLWHAMLVRCYDKKLHKKQPTYKKCYVCGRWLTLSNFVEDVVKIDNYEYWLNHPNERVSLDKDIKSNGINKCYCLKQCQFVSKSDNTKQANKTRKYDGMKGEKNPMYGKYGEKSSRARKVVMVDPLTKLPVFIWQYIKQVADFYDIGGSTLSRYLKGKAKSGHEYNSFLWYYLDEYEQLKESLI